MVMFVESCDPGYPAIRLVIPEPKVCAAVIGCCNCCCANCCCAPNSDCLCACNPPPRLVKPATCCPANCGDNPANACCCVDNACCCCAKACC